MFGPFVKPIQKKLSVHHCEENTNCNVTDHHCCQFTLCSVLINVIKKYSVPLTSMHKPCKQCINIFTVKKRFYIEHKNDITCIRFGLSIILSKGISFMRRKLTNHYHNNNIIIIIIIPQWPIFILMSNLSLYDRISAVDYTHQRDMYCL